MNKRRRAKLGGSCSGLSAAEGGTIRARRAVTRARLLLLPAVLASALLFAGCGVKTTHKVVSAAPVAGGTGWKPSTPIRVKEGRKVVIKVGNATKVTHGFSIDAFGVKQTVDAGKTINVKITPTAKGTYVVYCQLHPAHKKTELVVS
jgi:plastocyanin